MGFRWIFPVLLAFSVYVFLPESCPESARRMAAIFIFAAYCWATELIPYFATAIVVVLLLIFMLGESDYQTFLIPFSSPVIILFFGGFMLAKALQKYDVDDFLTKNVLLKFGSTPKRVLMGIMVTTGFLSMWMSNTATAAMMLGLVEGLVLQIDAKDPFRKALILAVPFSANIGGIATPIGTPPNVIALGNLMKVEQAPSFVQWMMIALPLAILLLGYVYIVLITIFPTKNPLLQLSHSGSDTLTFQAKKVLAIFSIVILLWLTTHFHHIPEAITALLGVALLVVTRLLGRQDINSIDWDVLILMWGGLALSVGMTVSGFSEWLVSLPLFATSGLLFVIAFCILGFFLSTFMSNTAAAALLIPIAISLPNENPVYLAITLALSCSFAMAFPISTPPNALAFAKGNITAKEMLKAGLPISIGSLFIMLLGFKVIINFILTP